MAKERKNEAVPVKDMAADNQAKTAGSTSHATPDRKRRAVIKAGIAATPLIMTLKGTPAMAWGWYGSGNLSGGSGSGSLDKSDPNWWKKPKGPEKA
jgi:hypothetical protein